MGWTGCASAAWSARICASSSKRSTATAASIRPSSTARSSLAWCTNKQFVYNSAVRIALWWLVVYPPFLQRQEDAATNIAKVWRGHLWGRRIYREEFAVAFSLRVKARRNLGVCLSEWIGTTEVVRTARRFFQRIQRQHTMVIFAAWPTYCRLMEKEREAKLEYAKGKLKERKIRVTFAAWAADTQVIRNTKKFVAEMMSGQATKAFRNWQKFVARRVLIRGALQIQRIVRGRLARRRVSLRRTRLTFIAVVFQGFFWAQRARKAVVARQQEVDKERAITAKGDRRSRQHREHERLITEHEMWKERKELYQEEAAADARRTLDDEMATKKGLKELAKKARAARKGAPGKAAKAANKKAMTKVEGMAYARAAWTNEVCDEAREKAGVEYEQSVNPPPSQCDRCGETFATHSQLAGHAGVCGADDLRDHLLLQEQQHAMQIRRVAPEMGSGGGGGGGGGSGSGSSGGHPLPLLDPRVDLIHGPSSARKAQYQTRFKDEALSAFEADVDPRTEADTSPGRANVSRRKHGWRRPSSFLRGSRICGEEEVVGRREGRKAASRIPSSYPSWCDRRCLESTAVHNLCKYNVTILFVYESVCMIATRSAK